MFGLTFDKLIVLAVIGVFILGPTRLPGYASKLASLVKGTRHMIDDLQQRARDELGPGYDDIDWQKLDPRQYDPRRIIREALIEPETDVESPASNEAPQSTPSESTPTTPTTTKNGA
jgi:sec-independent protein translocase protein TatB